MKVDYSRERTPQRDGPSGTRTPQKDKTEKTEKTERTEKTDKTDKTEKSPSVRAGSEEGEIEED